MTLTQAPVSVAPPAGAFVAEVELPPRDDTLAYGGMVASINQFAAAAGHEVLRQGGNAVDAAIAAAAVLTVVEPRNGHLGGDTFMQVHLAAENRVIALNGSGAAPAAATADAYRALGGIPEHGLLSSTVPGTVSAWALAAERFGSRLLGELLQTAIAYAREGVPVTPRLHRQLTTDAAVYRHYPASARVFLPDGKVPEVGETLRQPDLGDSLERIAQGGREEFYAGSLTERMVSFAAANGGLFTRADFAAHRTEELEPIRLAYRGYTVFEQPPVSQGIVVLLALNTLRHFDLPSLGLGSAETLHLLIEALKLAFADRLRWCGDPAFVDIPLDMLLSPEHGREQAGRIDPDRAQPLRLPYQVQPDTTSLCAADQFGNMVTYIHSLFSGAGVVLGDTGVLMNSRILGFSLDPDDPNCLAPGKRPMHTLNTYVVQKDGESVLVGGTPGAHWQVQTNLQMLTNLLDFGLDLQAAIAAPRFSIGDYESLGNPVIKLESRVPPETVDGLRRRGHEIEVIGPWASGGSVQLIAREPTTGLLRGATEIRASGSTVLGL
jgi:gamma-glutamyltranspeptidase/glutathione hydrolase